MLKSIYMYGKMKFIRFCLLISFYSFFHPSTYGWLTKKKEVPKKKELVVLKKPIKEKKKAKDPYLNIIQKNQKVSSHHPSKSSLRIDKISQGKYLTLSGLISVENIKIINNQTTEILLKLGDEEVKALYSHPSKETVFWYKGAVLAHDFPKTGRYFIKTAQGIIFLSLPSIFQIESINFNPGKKAYIYRIKEKKHQLLLLDLKKTSIDNNILYNSLEDFPVNTVGFYLDPDSLEEMKIKDLLAHQVSFQILEKNDGEIVVNSYNSPKHSPSLPSSYPKTRMAVPGFYTVKKVKQGELLIFKYYIKEEKFPSLVVKYNPQLRSIMEYNVMDKDQLVFQQSCYENPQLKMNYYPTDFLLLANSYFNRIILKKIIEKSQNIKGKDSYNTIKTIIAPLKNYETDAINLSNIIKSEMDQKDLHQYKHLVVVVPIQSVSYPAPHLRYHMNMVYFLLERVGNYLMLKKVIYPTSQINGFGLLFHRWKNFLLWELRKNSVNDYFFPIKNYPSSIITYSPYLAHEIEKICDFYQTKQLGYSCCYSASYKDLAKVFLHLPAIINNQKNPWSNLAINTKDIGMHGHILEKERIFNPSLFSNKLKQFFLSIKMIQNFSSVGPVIIFCLEVETLQHIADMPEGYLLPSSIAQKMASRYVIYFYANHNKEISIYIINRNPKVPIDPKKFLSIIETEVANNLLDYKILSTKLLSLEEWENPKNNNENLKRAKFLIKTNLIAASCLSVVDLYNCYRFDGDIDLENQPFHLNYILENKKKEILSPIEEDCFFHILFQISQLYQQQDVLLDKIINILL